MSACCCVAGCLYQGQECRLVIHYEHGFSVLADPRLAEGENGEERALRTPTEARALLSYPFEKLKMSSDDGVRMLFLNFGGREGEIVSGISFFFLEITDCPTKCNRTCFDKSSDRLRASDSLKANPSVKLV